MGKRGPKPRYATPEDFGRRVDEYFSGCEEENIFPDYAGLRVFLNLSQDRIDQLCKADYTGEDSIKYSEILLRARDRRESWLARTATSQPKVAQGCLNALKQQANGGWIDRPQDSGGGAGGLLPRLGRGAQGAGSYRFPVYAPLPSSISTAPHRRKSGAPRKGRVD